MKKLAFFLCFGMLSITKAFSLPSGFVYLKEVDPSIIQDIRYGGAHNFVGHPLPGYLARQCILTREAAEALRQVQQSLKPYHLSLKVYDCYRPQEAVNYFIEWSKDERDVKMQKEFYPKVPKSEVFELGYVAKKSGHTRGSTVDLTLVSLPASKKVQKVGELVSCTSPYGIRYADNSIDMGTGYDCLDEAASISAPVNPLAFKNRQWLKAVMEKNHFTPYEKEWWHFTLAEEPYPSTYFNFPITKKGSS